MILGVVSYDTLTGVETFEEFSYKEVVMKKRIISSIIVLSCASFFIRTLSIDAADTSDYDTLGVVSYDALTGVETFEEFSYKRENENDVLSNLSIEDEFKLERLDISTNLEKSQFQNLYEGISAENPKHIGDNYYVYESVYNYLTETEFNINGKIILGKR